jgi:Ca-activated chloride channel family protein
MVRTASRWLVMVAWGLLLVPLAAVDAGADPVVGVDPAGGPGRLLLVLDASGSMKEPASGGERKIDAARTALRAMVEALPTDQEVGLRVYGATVFSADEPGACTDSQRVVDLGTDNRDELLDAVEAYAPYGETPIGHALREAGTDLGPDGDRSIVLVSDGEPTCAPDPCKVAQQLAAQGIGLRIDVVGLDVSGAARDKLRCIADAGGGSYVDAGDAAELTDSLVDAQVRASRPFDFTGTPVQGTDGVSSAPELATGQFIDRIPASGSLFYRVPRTIAGSTVHAGLGYRGEVDTSAAIDLYLRVEEEAVSCARAIGYGFSVGARSPITYAGGSTWNPDPASPCNVADEVVVEIAPQPSAARLAGQPVELAIYEEPPLENGATAGSAPEQPSWTPLEPASPATPDVVPGTSIANAPVLEDGSFAGDLNPGETQVFAVPLDWGQDLQVQLDATITPAVDDAAAVGSALLVEIMGPTRSRGSVSFYGSAPGDWTTTAFGNLRSGDRFRTGAQSEVVDFAHRESADARSQGASVAGLRYVTVGLDVRGAEANQPYVLTIRTNGSPAPAPAYVTGDEVATLTAPEASSPLTVAAGDRADADSTPRPGAARPGDADPDGGGGLPTAVLLGAGGLLAVGIAVAAVVVLRSRRRRA